jgi:7-cyano-7-deazaguanine synthase in queuosine biosynthesis
MSAILFYCDTSYPSSIASSGEWEETIRLCQHGNDSNLRLDLDDVTAKILRRLDPIANDLVQIACYVYVGDQLVSRGGIADVYGRKWERNLHYVIPVSNPHFWCKHEIIDQLTETLNFLTGDKYSFTFIEGKNEMDEQLAFSYEELELANQGADCVVLFSGGADSLSAVVEQAADIGRRPILVSHRSTPIHDTRQTNLVGHLRRLFPYWFFPHVSVWANLKGQVAKDYTQRSRSFLYASLAAAVAYQTKVKEIILSDNGIVSINLPKNGHLKGTYASRTTHPKYLWNFQKLIRLILCSDLTVSNTLAFKTKAEAIEILKKHKCEELLQETVSCARTRQPQIMPHCGVCSQCIDRRFGSESAGLENNDISERYGVDIFSDAIAEGEDRAQVEIFIGFARHLEGLSDDGIFCEYPELLDCIVANDPNANQTAQSYISLLRRHAKQVRDVTKEKVVQYAERLYEASLPETSLLRLITNGEILKDQVEVLAEKIEHILADGLPQVFQSKEPENEHEVQDASEALLKAAGERLFRELPLLPFAGISTKPDYSKLDQSMYYVESAINRGSSRRSSQSGSWRIEIMF